MDTYASMTVSIIGVLLTGAAVYWSWRNARHAGTKAAIETHRQHAELTPVFRTTCHAQNKHSVLLELMLAGPVGLDGLDRVEAMLADPVPDRQPVIAGGPTQQELDDQVWGPYRFMLSTTGVVSHRTAEAQDVRPNTPIRFRLEQTPAPHWAIPAHWAEFYGRKPVLVTLDCYKDGFNPWRVERQAVVMQ
ncbi:hypothetical protein [Streptomonospora salina]|uniref:Uncharacterized protein n=1 Tax=Streptomonospora salina TaxID=104205 RepID=A0A841EAK3_9ACTN|nr:hypothetical protein [Streptomonospora salina]MBB6000145.1 hypothetical protein [Streptomonospora salina]